MAESSGMLTVEALRDAATAGTIDTVIVAFTDHYGRLHGKRLDAAHFLDEAVEHGSHGCDYLLTTDMEMDPVAGYDYANWELGYGDFHLVPDLSTMRVADWLDRTAIVLSDLEQPQAREPVAVAPRSILRKQVARAADAGFTAKAASELEYFIFEDSYRSAAAAGYAGLTPVGWYSEDYHLLQGTREEFFNGAARRALRRSGIPVETSKGETGSGTSSCGSSTTGRGQNGWPPISFSVAAALAQLAWPASSGPPTTGTSTSLTPVRANRTAAAHGGRDRCSAWSRSQARSSGSAAARCLLMVGGWRPGPVRIWLFGT